MTAGMKCPKCGLMQMAGPTCKACGAALSGPAPAAPEREAPEQGAAGPGLSWLPQPRKLLILGGVGLGLLLLGVLVYRPAGPPARSTKLTEVERRAAAEAVEALRRLQSATTVGVAYRDYAQLARDAKFQVDRYLRVSSSEKRDKAIQACLEEGGNELFRKGFTGWDEETQKQARAALVRRCQPEEELREAMGRGDRIVRGRVENAMELYLLAARAWNAKIGGDVPMREIAEHILLDREVGLCPSVTRARDAAQATAPVDDRDYAGYRAVVERIPELWGCASRVLDEAEATIEEYS